ncbi:hypothetical protein OEZ85_012724 [Tetradesmus obliquus]|uniref:SGNH hydrolase-type esterase domain-containing protein n=1 Tax=Tetradesmus obliquus TaxID=3088 RepID=A0ABY8U3R5_TETOB|nr:hypothetical protein OEZ85_012724 [Tetradesmus obliquus]
MANKTAAAYTAAVLLALLCSSWAVDAARLLRQDTDIRILAIGDSITEGSVPSKNTNHPYTIQLEQQLRKLRPNARITIDNEGVGGAGIFAVGFHKQTTIPPLAERAIQRAKRHGTPYDYVIVMLGINDLLRMGKSAEEVKGGLQQIYGWALDAGSNVIAIPPFGAPGFVSKDDYKEGERKKLADMVRGMAAGENSRRASSPKVAVLNLQATTMDFYNMDDAERSRWLDDGLHLTEFGYDVLGRAVARAIDRNLAE